MRVKPGCLERYRERTNYGQFLFSLAYLGVTVLETLPLTKGLHGLLLIDGLLWSVFVADYVLRLVLAKLDPEENAGTYWHEGWNLLDMAVIASFPLLFVDGLAFLSYARIPRAVLQGVRCFQYTLRTGSNTGERGTKVRNSSLALLAPMTVWMVVLSTLVVWRYERAIGHPSIVTFWDALWWAVVTLGTVGYGDLSPSTAEGRVAGIILILFGVTFFGWVTASLASLFANKRPETEMTAALERLRQQFEELQQRVDKGGQELPPSGE